MRLLLIRHGIPGRVEGVEGPPDPPLTDAGRRQTAEAVTALDGEPVDAIWSSTLRRAIETAEPLAARRGLPVQQHPGLVEFDFGFGGYIPVEETDHPAITAFAERLRHQAEDRPLQEFRQVVASAVQEIIDASPADSTVAVVCHGGVISAFTSSVLGVSDVIFFTAAYTSVSRFDIGRSGRIRLDSLNEYAHLRRLTAAEAGQAASSPISNRSE